MATMGALVVMALFDLGAGGLVIITIARIARWVLEPRALTDTRHRQAKPLFQSCRRRPQAAAGASDVAVLYQRAGNTKPRKATILFNTISQHYVGSPGGSID